MRVRLTVEYMYVSISDINILTRQLLLQLPHQIQGGHDHVYITDDLCKHGFYHYTHHLSGHYTNVPVRFTSFFFKMRNICFQFSYETPTGIYGMNIRFTTNHNYEYYGFKMSWEAIP